MKNRNAVLFSIILGSGLSLWPVPQVNGETGGLPTLATRVTTLETNMTTQQTVTTTLDDRVATLEHEIDTLLDDVLTLLNDGPKFAVVDADGTIRPSSRTGVQEVKHLDDDGHPITGHYLVFFDRDVSKCAVTVTAEPLGSEGIIASINGTFRGIEDATHPKTLVLVVLSDADNNRVDRRFNIVAVC